jgi:hypothetical protein
LRREQEGIANGVRIGKALLDFIQSITRFGIGRVLPLRQRRHDGFFKQLRPGTPL